MSKLLTVTVKTLTLVQCKGKGEYLLEVFAFFLIFIRDVNTFSLPFKSFFSTFFVKEIMVTIISKTQLAMHGPHTLVRFGD